MMIRNLRIAFFICWAIALVGNLLIKPEYAAVGKLIGNGFGLVGMFIAFYLFFLFLKHRFAR